MELKVVEKSDRCTHVQLIGKMNAPGAMEIDRLFTELVAERLRPAIVDLSEVPFLSSLGVRTLLYSIRALHRVQARMVLVNPQPDVVKVLETAGLGSVAPRVKTVEEARTLLRPEGVPNPKQVPG